jgi:predicted unusual protein kinase regulating ubiquinone biosynthesis (AarF/ABC1/UbiB family)
MLFFRYYQNAYIAALLTFRVSVVALGIGCNVYWYGKTWLIGTSNGGKFLSTSLRSIGVIGIKLGQYCSQRPDIFSDTCRLELSRLTDRNQPVPWNRLKTQIDRVYDVDICPMGTGSLAQVHPIEWQTKRSVLKILSPEYEQTLFELQCCRYVLETMEYIGILPVGWGTFIDETVRQLDLRNEAEELVYAYDLFGGSEGLVLDGIRIRVPELLYKSRLSIAMERATGKPLHSLVSNIQATRTANNARRAALIHMTTFGDRRFHADLHDGNVLFDEDSSTLWLIDFGRCAHPPPDWTSPLSSILRFASDKTCKSAARDLLCSVFSVTESEATQLLPIFNEMFVSPRTIADSTRTFFQFTRRTRMVISPHTMAYLMQLAAITTE